MGQLVFQATLGGAVNIIGPNIAGTVNFTLPSADGTSGQALTTNGSGTLAFTTVTATPGGSTTQVQYNNAGVFAGSANMTFNGTSLTLANGASIQGLTVGRGAGAVATNTAVGASALAAVTGGFNSAFGQTAGSTITSGTENVSIGQGSMSNGAVTGDYNTTVGVSSTRNLTTGVSNSALGHASLNVTTTGSYNTAIGKSALQSNTTASNGTAVGYQAGYGITTGGGNTCIGQGTANYSGSGGAILTTGYNNTYLGNYACASASNSYGEMVIAASGNGTQPVGKGSHTGFIYCGGGGVYQGNNSSSWSTTSDQRLKKNIADNNVGLDAITSIRVRNFEYRLPNEVDAELKPSDAIQKTGIQLGVIAQELQAVLPECVKQESTGVLSVNTDNLTWYLVNAVKELKAEFDAYKASHP
jgi:hypothetical protein